MPLNHVAPPEDLRTRMEQLGSLLDDFFLGAVGLSADRRVVFVNRAAETITGCQASAILGRPCREAMGELLCGGGCGFDDAMKNGGKSEVADLEVADGNRELHSITKVFWTICDAAGKPSGCMEIFQDYTAFKDLIRRVRHEDRKLKIILDNLDIGILTLDRGGHITFFNAMSENITGYSRNEALGKPCSLIFEKGSLREVQRLMGKDGGKARGSRQGEVVTRQGEVLPIRANYMALNNEAGRNVGGLVTFSDLSLAVQLDNVMKDRYTFYDMVGKDPVVRKIFDIVPVVAESDATVLIEGPTGTGKDLMARVIHNASKRSKKTMVKVNCAALPDSLLESEMFGYVKGAFTGADYDKPGRFQEADGGTIFLDEIGDLPFSLQAKLLRVIEDREFYPLGGRKTCRVDVRIIAATNQGLEKLAGERRFREDLFYRLNVMRIELPSLRERKGDLPLLISHILKRLCAVRETKVERISEEAMKVMLDYDYPGNVRELENILEHALIICQDNAIELRHLPVSLQKRVMERQGMEGASPDLISGMAESEKTAILSALKKHNWNRGKAAMALRINRTTLWRKIRKYGL